MIENPRYTKENDIIAIIDGIEVYVPNNMANRHRQMIKEWEDEGNTIEPYIEPVDVPQVISRSQMLRALNHQGLLTSQEVIDAAVSGIVPASIQAVFDNMSESDKTDAIVLWATMTQAERNHPLVSALALANSMSEEDIDNFFIYAASLT